MGQQDIPGIDATNAVSLYGNSEAMDEFPVLKAFQQYIDAEQAKSRKRMLSLAIMFGVLMAGVVAVFVGLLINISQRNQSLNDRLIEFAMKERTQQQQPTGNAQTQDSSAILSMYAKIDALQKQMEANQQKAEKIVEEAAVRSRKAESEDKPIKKGDAETPSRQSEEIAALKALLQIEKEKLLAEKEKVRQAELEAYRRKHYPECYATPKTKSTGVEVTKKPRKDVQAKLDAELDEELDDDAAINYFDDNEDEKPIIPVKKKIKEDLETIKSTTKVDAAPATPVQQKEIQLNVNGKTSSWSIPID